MLHNAARTGTCSFEPSPASLPPALTSARAPSGSQVTARSRVLRNEPPAPVVQISTTVEGFLEFTGHRRDQRQRSTCKCALLNPSPRACFRAPGAASIIPTTRERLEYQNILNASNSPSIRDRIVAHVRYSIRNIADALIFRLRRNYLEF